MHLNNSKIRHENTENGFAKDLINHFQTDYEVFFNVNRVLRSGFHGMAKIMLLLPNLLQATEGNQDPKFLKGADFKSGFTFFLK